MPLIGIQGYDADSTRAGELGGHCAELGLVHDRAGDPPVLVLPDDFHQALVGQRGQGCIDVGEQVRPDFQLGARCQLGAHRLDVVAGEAVPPGGVRGVGLLQERGAVGADRPVQASPEVGVGRALYVLGVVGGEVVRRGVQAFGEQLERAGAGQRRFAGLAAADVEVLVPADVHRECSLRLQTAPGAVVAEHGPNEFQADGDRHQRTVVEPGEASREQVGQTVAVDRWLQTEVDEASDLRLADGQLVDAGFLGEGGNGLQVGGFDRSVVAGRGLGAGVVAVLIAVGGVVLGDLVDVGQHVTACRKSKVPLHSRGVRGRGRPWRG